MAAPVTEVIGDRLWPDDGRLDRRGHLDLGVALPIGIYSAVRQYSPLDYLFTLIGFIGLAVPGFLLALLVLYFGVYSTRTSAGCSRRVRRRALELGQGGRHGQPPAVPAVILAIAGMAQAIRIMRANLLDELRKPYVVTARAKGLSESRAILKYPVRVALNPFASTIGYTLPYVVSGSIIVSLVLGLPTVGPLLLRP